MQRQIAAARAKLCDPSTSDESTTNTDDDEDYQQVVHPPIPSRNETSSLQVQSALPPQHDVDISEALSHSRSTTEDEADEPDDHAPLLSSEDDHLSDTEEDSLKNGLCKWYADRNVNHAQMDSLLKLLTKHGVSDLPLTARTLLRTTMTYNVVEISGMQYTFLGFRNNMEKHLAMYPRELLQNTDEVHFSLNLDGLPMFKSTKKGMWPLLCCIHLDPNTVFPVVLTYGPSKPTNHDFLTEALREVKDVLENGIQLLNEHVVCRLRAVICDAPAKAFAKQVTQFNGRYGCDRCELQGDRVGDKRRQLFLTVDDLPLRTDESFRNQQQVQHHKGVSAFCDLPMDMVTGFPLDYMHLLCLGVMKKLLFTWVKGPREFRISQAHVQRVSDALVSLQPFIPAVFARKPRSLVELERFKATEFRQFLLYTGKVVLKDVLKPDQYAHFVALSLASCIMVSPSLAKKHLAFSRKLLKYFVVKTPQLYGVDFLVYNVHCLLHLCDDVDVHGCLDNFSAFPFENHLQTIKKLVRSPKNPVVQVARRLSEIPVSKYVRKRRCIGVKRPNNAYLLSGDIPCEVCHATSRIEDDGDRLFMCRVARQHYSLETTDQWDVGVVGAFHVNWGHSERKLISEKELTRNAILIPMNNEINKSIFLTILHQV